MAKLVLGALLAISIGALAPRAEAMQLKRSVRQKNKTGLSDHSPAGDISRLKLRHFIWHGVKVGWGKLTNILPGKNRPKVGEKPAKVEGAKSALDKTLRSLLKLVPDKAAMEQGVDKEGLPRHFY